MHYPIGGGAMAKKWYCTLDIRGITNHDVVWFKNICFHMTDRAGATSEHNSPTFSRNFSVRSEGGPFITHIAYKLCMYPQPEHKVTYERELYLKNLTPSDLLLKEGPRCRRIVWENFTRELVIFLLQPSLNLQITPTQEE